MTETTDTDDGTDEAGPRTQMADAIDEIRREGLKAALVYAVVDAAAAFLAVNLLLAVLDPGWLPARVTLPGVADAVGASDAVTVPGSAVLAAAVGVAAFVGELWYRTRRPLVEQFEAVNPAVAESLRTARDAVASGADTRMARRLYRNVLDGLRESSSLGLVSARRVGASLAVIVVVSLLTVQVAVVDVALLGGASPAANDSGGEPTNYTGLRDGDAVLGAPSSVETGNETLTARVESSGGGQEIDEEDQFPGDPAGGGGGSGDAVDSQQAGFEAPDDVADADLVREYNERIRADADASGDDDANDDSDEN